MLQLSYCYTNSTCSKFDVAFLSFFYGSSVSFQFPCVMWPLSVWLLNSCAVKSSWSLVIRNCFIHFYTSRESFLLHSFFSPTDLYSIYIHTHTILSLSISMYIYIYIYLIHHYIVLFCYLIVLNSIVVGNMMIWKFKIWKFQLILMEDQPPAKNTCSSHVFYLI